MTCSRATPGPEALKIECSSSKRSFLPVIKLARALPMLLTLIFLGALRLDSLQGAEALLEHLEHRHCSHRHPRAHECARHSPFSETPEKPGPHPVEPGPPFKKAEVKRVHVPGRDFNDEQRYLYSLRAFTVAPPKKWKFHLTLPEANIRVIVS
ncbi:hypothetical protein TSAR_016751, partial [Trichomalopsis sarcophagae]